MRWLFVFLCFVTSVSTEAANFAAVTVQIQKPEKYWVSPADTEEEALVLAYEACRTQSKNLKIDPKGCIFGSISPQDEENPKASVCQDRYLSMACVRVDQSLRCSVSCGNDLPETKSRATRECQEHHLTGKRTECRLRVTYDIRSEREIPLTEAEKDSPLKN